MTNLILTTPDILIDSIFSAEKIELSRAEISVWTKELLVHHYFPYDTCFYNGIECFTPWNHADSVIPDLISVWGSERKTLDDFFSNRQSQKALIHMKRAISLWISALFWLNGRPAGIQNWPKLVSELTLLPINAVERLSFVLERPALFHSYKQLTILFNELEKMFYKELAIKKRLS
ncbi:YpoC family protein [Peribacillus deserti]|uniref:YpoC-like domain-containing protein n=1 Tax=Peribacillus deserti TaxID=673318 RepID=A0A2N5M1Y1_9BACI|nr:hypothetical protein [Peribacillus deserti]PLT28367.1 hypothetical protein CUU66_19315 [Peribacillus deserti]